MIEFIFTTILMICLGIVLYVTVQALPRITEEPADNAGLFERWANSGIPERIDATFNAFLLKFLRKVKVSILRLDNTVARHLRKVQPKENKANTSIDFKEISGQNVEGKDEDKEIE